MSKFLKNLIDEFPELIKGRAATPAHDKLFVIRDEKDARRLSEEQVLAFHHTVANCCSWQRERDEIYRRWWHFSQRE